MSDQLGHVKSQSRIESVIGLVRQVMPRDTLLWRGIAIGSLLCLLIFLAFYNLYLYPSPDAMPGYIDDAQHLMAAKKLALEGKYDFGPATGPTIILPIAAAMHFFGTDHLPGHIVMALYLLLDVAAFYALARRLGDWKVSLAATLLYIIAPGVYLIYLGRRVMGEVPAVLFTLAGILVFFIALDESRKDRRLAKSVLAGIFFGLAVLSKNQFLLLFPAWAVLWVLDRVYYRQAGYSAFIVPVLSAITVITGWYVAQWVLFPNGQELAAHNLSQWTDAPSRGILTLSPRKISEALRFLTDGSVLYALVLPALLYAGLRSFRRSKEGFIWATLFTVTTLWLGWFTFFSVTWYRYAFLPLTLSAIFVAHFFYDVTGGFRVPVSELVGSIRSGQLDMALAGRSVLMALFVVLMVRSLIGRLSEVIPQGCNSHQQMADYIVEHVPPDALIETYNPEVCFLSGRSCLLPPGDIQDAVIRYVWYDGPPPSNYYRPRASYLLIGYTGFWSGIYDMRMVKSDYALEKAIGDSSATVADTPCRYDLYRMLKAN